MTGRVWRGARPRRTAFLDFTTGAAVSDKGVAFLVPPAEPYARGCAPGGVTVPLFDPREQLGALLRGLPPLCERVYLVGDDVPFHSWYSMVPPDGWGVAGRGHHPDDATPALRFARGEQNVEIRSAREWFGDRAMTPREARDAWVLLGERLQRVDGWTGAQLFASPSTTGRQLLEMLDDLPAPLGDDAAAIVREAMVGGRVHLAEPVRKGAKMPGLAYYDARVAYGALAQLSIGCAPAVHDTSAELPLDSSGKLRARGWLKVTVRPPDEWAHVGIVPFRAEPKAPVEYPTRGSFVTWADTAELAVALEHGWRVDVHERLLLDQGAPLRGWARRLETLWRKLSSDDELGVPGQLAAAAVRAVALKTVGALATTSYRTRRVFRDAADVPAGLQFWQDDGGAWISDDRHASNMPAYPELAAQIWARGRVRLLDAPTADKAQRAGALHVAAHELVAMRTDALYLTRDPDWPDDGASWGRFRRKGVISRPRVWPSDVRRLIVLREEAESQLAKLQGAH